MRNMTAKRNSDFLNEQSMIDMEEATLDISRTRENTAHQRANYGSSFSKIEYTLSDLVLASRI